jgi:hypothetical protein
MLPRGTKLVPVSLQAHCSGAVTQRARERKRPEGLPWGDLQARHD